MPLNPLSSMAAASETSKVQKQSFHTICNLCSVGCTLELSHDNGNIVSVTGAKGLINPSGEYCRYPQSGYTAISGDKRITQPLLRTEDGFRNITWGETFSILHDKITEQIPDEKAFFAGARLTNEEQYLVMKLSRACAYSNNIGSFHYLGRGTNYTKLSRANIPFAELIESKKICIIGAELFRDNPVAGDFIFKFSELNNIQLQLVTDKEDSELIDHIEDRLVIKSYFHFIKAVNYYIVKNELEDREYIKNLVENFTHYKEQLLALDFTGLCKEAGVDEDIVKQFAGSFRDESHAVIVFSESQLSSHACGEIFNLALLTGKHGRTGAGLLLLKENNNSHGLHDTGCMWNLGPGATPWDDPFQRSTAQFIWGSKDLPSERGCSLHKLRETGYKSVFIFGEDPVGCAVNPDEMRELLGKSSFIAVQDYIMTPTAEMANLILPASFPYETGGTFTNCQRVIQKVDRRLPSPLEYNTWDQLNELISMSGYPKIETIDDVTFELASLLPKFCTSSKLLFRMNTDDNLNPMFNWGCDVLHRLMGK